MHKCKNDSNATYIGNEPSPKGRGFCAHAERMKSKMKGKDKCVWTIVKNKNGIKRWVKLTTVLMKVFKEYLKKTKTNDKDIKKFHKLIKEMKELNYYDFKPQMYKRILKSKKYGKVNFNVKSTKMIISDPALYKPYGTMKMWYKYDVIPGKWEGYYHTWMMQERPSIMVVSNSKYKYPSKKIKYEYKCGFANNISVDSGAVMVVDYDIISKAKNSEEKSETWYDKYVTKSITTSKRAFKIDGGYVCSSGWGDGGYDFAIGRVNGKVVQFIVYFISILQTDNIIRIVR